MQVRARCLKERDQPVFADGCGGSLWGQWSEEAGVRAGRGRLQMQPAGLGALKGAPPAPQLPSTPGLLADAEPSAAQLYTSCTWHPSRS